MKSVTHIPFSAVFLQGYCLFSGDIIHPAMFAAAALASLLPDIDTEASSAGSLIRPIASFMDVYFGHRTITHSIIGTLILALLLWPVTIITIPLSVRGLFSAAIVGYISHLVLDMSNKEGIEFTWPLGHRWVFPKPEKYRIAVGSSAEKPLRFLMVGVALLLFLFHTKGPTSVLHRILATPSAASTEYYQQLLREHRVEARISGIWTKSQAVLSDESFEIIAADSAAIYVRRNDSPDKIYCVSEGGFSSISHAKVKARKIGRARAKIFHLSFSNEKWDETLSRRFPKAILSGKIQTSAYPPTFDIDEYPTIITFSGQWELVHTPIQLLNRVLASQTITGKINLRYWEADW